MSARTDELIAKGFQFVPGPQPTSQQELNIENLSQDDFNALVRLTEELTTTIPQIEFLSYNQGLQTRSFEEP